MKNDAPRHIYDVDDRDGLRPMVHQPEEGLDGIEDPRRAAADDLDGAGRQHADGVALGGAGQEAGGDGELADREGDALEGAALGGGGEAGHLCRSPGTG